MSSSVRAFRSGGDTVYISINSKQILVFIDTILFSINTTLLSRNCYTADELQSAIIDSVTSQPAGSGGGFW